MLLTSKKIILLSCFLSLLAVGWLFSRQTPLNASQIEGLIAGNTLRDERGSWEFHDTLGFTAFRVDGGEVIVGHWFTENDQLCYVYPFSDIRRHCWTVHQTGPNQLRQYAQENDRTVNIQIYAGDVNLLMDLVTEDAIGAAFLLR